MSRPYTEMPSVLGASGPAIRDVGGGLLSFPDTFAGVYTSLPLLRFAPPSRMWCEMFCETENGQKTPMKLSDLAD